jgi:acyl-homoserine lactone acylase PvdQ
VQAKPSQSNPKPTKITDDEDRSQASAAPESYVNRRTTSRAPSISRFLRNGWDTQNLNTPLVLESHEDTLALRALLGLPSCTGCEPGSNNWVIAGCHTASGKPMLSNDMHLGLTEPNIWYMADLKANGNHGAPDFHAAGVTLPGMPCVIAGHNEHVAWGFTALYADVQDLYIEQLDGKGNFQNLDGDWKPLQIDHEVIKVRGGKDVVLDVQLTAHGPLLNPIMEKEKRPIVDPLRPNPQLAASLPTQRRLQLEGVFRRACHLVLAHAECGLQRRSGTHCLSRDWQSSGARRRIYSL